MKDWLTRVTRLWNGGKAVSQVQEQESLQERLQRLEAELAQLRDAGRQAEELAQLRDAGRQEREPTQLKDGGRQEQWLRPIRDMAGYVMANYDFRHNVVRDLYEYRRKGSGGGWLPVDRRQMNSINCRIQDDGRIFCLTSYVRQRVESDLAVDYHPIRAYLDRVRGTWDGVDRVTELAQRISGSAYCLRMVPVWLRAVVMQWLGADADHANSVMLLLVSERQGVQKSTFLHGLMPPEIADYYTDDFSLLAKGNAYRKMVEFGLVSLDEFDKLPRRKMPELKSMMQTLKPSFIGAYQKNFNRLPRIASFVGTSNERHLLTDPTGSRRFLILEPDGVIRTGGIDHDQLYAQLTDEVERQHLPHYFSKADEAEMERHNRQYYAENEVERLFLSHFAVPQAAGEGKYMEGRELMGVLAKHSRKAMSGVSANQFGRYMTRLRVPRVHLHDNDVYRVVEK